MTTREKNKYNALIKAINLLTAAGSLMLAFQFLIISLLLTSVLWSHFWAGAALITFVWTGFFTYCNVRGR